MTNSSAHATLRLDLLNYWHAGSGTGSGQHLDALCLRDRDGLPFLPGRQLKGLLRHAVRRAEAWGWYRDLSPADMTLEALLFGSNSQEDNRYQTEPGLLQVDNACLATTEHDWLALPEQALEREQLFAELFSTALNDDGTARDHSLRGLEVCLPVSLSATLTLDATALNPARRTAQHNWLAQTDPWQALRLALPLIDAIGAHRSRGLGEARLTLDRVGQP